MIAAMVPDFDPHEKNLSVADKIIIEALQRCRFSVVWMYLVREHLVEKELAHINARHVLNDDSWFGAFGPMCVTQLRWHSLVTTLGVFSITRRCPLRVLFVQCVAVFVLEHKTKMRLVASFDDPRQCGERYPFPHNTKTSAPYNESHKKLPRGFDTRRARRFSSFAALGFAARLHPNNITDSMCVAPLIRKWNPITQKAYIS